MRLYNNYISSHPFLSICLTQCAQVLTVPRKCPEGQILVDNDCRDYIKIRSTPPLDDSSRKPSVQDRRQKIKAYRRKSGWGYPGIRELNNLLTQHRAFSNWWWVTDITCCKYNIDLQCKYFCEYLITIIIIITMIVKTEFNKSV